MTDRDQSDYADSIIRLTIAMREMLGMGLASDKDGQRLARAQVEEADAAGAEERAVPCAASFCAVVDRIVLANRRPTAWEAGCLYAALCELAIGHEKSARRAISLALMPGAHQELPVSITPLPTAEELLQALALISQTDSPIPPQPTL